MKKLPLLKRNRLVTYILLAVSFGFMYLAVQNSHALRAQISTEPAAFSYSFDGLSFLKTFYRMRSGGVDFYTANLMGIAADARAGPPPLFVSGWRLPTIFYTWTLFAQNGQQIWMLFVLVSVLALWASFDIVASVAGVFGALIAAFLLVPYFYFAATSLQFLLVEWWGVGIALIGVAFLLRKRFGLAVALLLFAALVREVFAVMLVVGLVLAAMRRTRILFFYFAGALAVFAVLYGVHFLRAQNTLLDYTDMHLSFFGQSFGGGGVLFVRQTLAYATAYLPTTPLGIQLPLIALVFVGATAPLVLPKQKSFAQWFVFTTILVYVGLFLIWGTPDNDYWGVFYVPLLFVLFAQSIAISAGHLTRSIR